MNERDEDTRFSHGDPQQYINPIVNGFSDIFEALHKLKENADAGIEVLFQPIGEAVGGVRFEVMQAIEDRLRQACDKEKEVATFLMAKIEGELGAISGIMGYIEAALSKHEKRLEKLKRPSIKGTADATLSDKVGAMPQTSPTPQVAQQLPAGTQPVPASFLDITDIFPPAPTKDELAYLVLPMPAGQGYIGVSQLPQEMWDKNNGVGWFLSIAPTPISRVVINLLEDKDGQFLTGNSLFVNTTYDMSDDEIRHTVQSFPIDHGLTQILNRQEAWNVASNVYGEPVVRSVWEMYNIPPPAMQQAPPHLPPLRQARQATPTATPDERGEPPTITPSGEQVEPQDGPKECPPPPCPEINFTGLPDVLRNLLPNIGIPTFDQVCEASRPVYRYLGIPEELQVPCTTMRATKTYMERRMSG